MRSSMKYIKTEEIKESDLVSDQNSSYVAENYEGEQMENSKYMVNTCVVVIKREDGTTEVLFRQQAKKSKTLKKKTCIVNSKKFQKRLNTEVRR